MITAPEKDEKGTAKRNHAEIYNQAPIYNAGEIIFANDKMSHFPSLMNNKTGHYKCP